VGEAFAAGEHAFLNENRTTTCSRSRTQLRLTSKGSLIPGRGGDGRGAACRVGYPAQGAGLGGQNGAVSVSYNSPGFLAQRHHLEGALRAPFDAVESIVEALPGA
jgi:hypothetical protein